MLVKAVVLPPDKRFLAHPATAIRHSFDPLLLTPAIYYLPPSTHQAVIGAGASGLVAARELRREGHDVLVLEQQRQLGGTWVYTDEVRAAAHSTQVQACRCAKRHCHSTGDLILQMP